MSQAISKMETTQTAMQALVELMKINDIYKPCMPYLMEIIDEVYLPMEKEQMHKCASFWRGKENEIEKPMFDLYYKETYDL